MSVTITFKGLTLRPNVVSSSLKTIISMALINKELKQTKCQQQRERHRDLRM